MTWWWFGLSCGQILHTWHIKPTFPNGLGVEVKDDSKAQWFIKCGHQTSNNRVIRKLAENAQSWTSPQIYWIKNSGGWGLSNLVFLISFPGDFDVSLSLRTTACKGWSWQWLGRWGYRGNRLGEKEGIRGSG